MPLTRIPLHSPPKRLDRLVLAQRAFHIINDLTCKPKNFPGLQVS